MVLRSSSVHPRLREEHISCLIGTADAESVVPAKAGIQGRRVDSRFRGNDGVLGPTQSLLQRCQATMQPPYLIGAYRWMSFGQFVFWACILGFVCVRAQGG